MAYIQLSGDERMVLQGHPSWRSTMAFYVKGALIAGAIGVLVALIDANGTGVAAALVVFGVVLLVGFVRRWTTVYTVTTRRLHIKRGIVARHTQEAKLSRVQNINTRQSVIERVLQVGTVDFDTAGSGETQASFAFEGVNDPIEMAHAIELAQRGDPEAQQHEASSGQGL